MQILQYMQTTKKESLGQLIMCVIHALCPHFPQVHTSSWTCTYVQGTAHQAIQRSSYKGIKKAAPVQTSKHICGCYKPHQRRKTDVLRELLQCSTALWHSSLLTSPIHRDTLKNVSPLYRVSQWLTGRPQCGCGLSSSACQPVCTRKCRWGYPPRASAIVSYEIKQNYFITIPWQHCTHFSITMYIVTMTYTNETKITWFTDLFHRTMSPCWDVVCLDECHQQALTL